MYIETPPYIGHPWDLAVQSTISRWLLLKGKSWPAHVVLWFYYDLQSKQITINAYSNCQGETR